MFKEVFDRLGHHASSFTLTVTLVIIYLMDGGNWVNYYLPANGKPLVIFLLVSVVIVYEMSLLGQKKIDKKINNVSEQVNTILHQMEINRLVASVNAMHSCFIQSDDDYIDNEYTIKELAELTDTRDRLGVNSYTQGRIEYLQSKVLR